MKGVGEKVNSDSLINSGEDATLDSIISASTVVAAIIYLTTGFALEAYLGAIISLVIVKSGIDMLKETISRILGESVDADIVKDIHQTVLNFEEVHGVYDIVLTDFGPDSYRGSLHIEVKDTYTADELDELIRSHSRNHLQEIQCDYYGHWCLFH